MYLCNCNPSTAVQECLRKMLLFDKLEADVQRKIVMEMYERSIKAGDILIQEGDIGIAASELYVVKEGEFEVGTPACHGRCWISCA